ncbi:hypothetical protein OSB04_016120 [Centaurea solstitialis]|uniref:Uncharacterized protein n=1 Tax=Centaurea solstitialis TaxID=347529 RepID=A0AA38T0B4_9ASTR|nr:hypothetical protein OSB04_016120 [Centaurea solstitialis]
MAYTCGVQMLLESLKKLIHGNHHPLFNNNPLILSKRRRFILLYQELDSIIQTLLSIHEDHLHPSELEKVRNLKKRFKDAAEEAQDTIDLFLSALHSRYSRLSPRSAVFQASLDLFLSALDFRKSGVSTRSDVFKTSLDLEKVLKSIESIKVELMTINITNMKMDSSSRIDHVKNRSVAGVAGTSYTRNPIRIKKPLEEIVVGLDHDAEIIRDKLSEDTKQLCVVSIVGMGGLGKTTLATKLFNDPFIKYHFHIRAWATVSQTYIKRDFLIQILVSIGVQQSLDQATDAQLREKLHKKLIGRRYLIVIDDIWSIEAWDELKLFFPHDNTASRILVTSRLNEVALHVKPHGFVHSLHCLTEEESWELLKQKVFHDDECPEWLIKPGRQIARKCQGLPLSLVVIAGVLAKEPMNKDLWLEIARSIKTLALSYHHLPDHLKECFLYLGGFPEDFRFVVERLIWLWVAEGFIEEAENRSLEDTAKACLMDLINRNLVIVAERNEIGDIEACKLHDLVRELCLQKAKEERFFLKIDSPPLPSQHLEAVKYKQRRVFTNEDINIVDFTLYGIFASRTIRSLLCFRTDIHSSKVIPRSFVLLKVLDLQKCPLRDFPQGLALLVHLRYLAIWYSSGFPESICKLWSLQTLILKANSVGPMCLPHEVQDLLNLRHLWSNVRFCLPYIEKPMNLQSISSVKFECGVDNLEKRFPIIKKLDLCCFRDEEYHFELLPYLETLSFVGSGSRRNHIWFPTTLKKLTLTRCCLPWSGMPTIQSLTNLEVLKLCWDAFMGTRWDACEQQFPQLKVLMLSDLNIKRWVASSTSFPCLKRLTLRYCRDLGEIPLEIGEIATLELIEIDNSGNGVVESVKRIQQEQHEVGNDELKITINGMDLSLHLSRYEGSEGLPPRSDIVSKTYLNPKNAMRSNQCITAEIRFTWVCPDYILATCISMADAAVEFLLSNLKQLLVYNVHLISSVKGEVESLCTDLHLLAAFVKDATDSRDQPEIVKRLVKEIRIEVYKAEDIIDMFVVHASVQNSRTSFKKLFHIPEHTKKLHSIGKQIQDIRQRVKDIKDDKWFAREALVKREPGRKSPPAVEEDDVVGFDKEAEEMMGWLKDGTKELDVISVVGMGGLGKTTLVRKVYDDLSIQYEFFIRSWVYVSQVYTRREVFLKILHNVTRENKDTSQWSDDIVAEELRLKLKDGRYLIVLDDVWTRQAWDDLKMVFPNTKNGSRIVLTSRNTSVALHANTNRPPYQLRFLTEDESWELLEKKVFPKDSHCPDDLEDLGKRIAKKCYGLPLALVVIAGILHKKDRMRSSWEEVEKKVNTYVAKEPDQCMEVLALSYDHLPYDLKACFLYFGVFPEDFEIPVRKLIHVWVAEGFIQRSGDISAEEMAEENLQDLVDRNLVLVEKKRANGRIKTCRIHDMLHDMCIKRAEEEDFFKEIKSSEPSSYINSAGSTALRRLCVDSRLSSYLSSKPDPSHVRSFLCYAEDKIVLPPDLIRDFPGLLLLLRVLDVQPISFSRFPSLQLVHLRYVAVSGTFKVLPAAISNLLNLQTLIVETTSRTIDVKADLWKLLQLRHVYTSGASNLPIPSPKSGNQVLVNENLRTMSKVSPETCTDVILARTPNLQKLGVRGNLMSLMEETKGRCKFDNITKLSNLKTLKLLNDTFAISPLDGKLGDLPGWYKFPPKLKKLTISGTMLNWEHMSTLGKLPDLEVLKLGDNAFVGKCWETPDGRFLRLRILEIGKTDLAVWKPAVDQFPQLQRLSLKNCEQLGVVPSALGSISTLEVVELWWTSHSAVASARLILKKIKLVVFPPDHLETQT